MHLFIWLLFSWVFGQILSINLCCGIRISLLDAGVLLLMISYLFQKQTANSHRFFLKTLGPFVLVGMISLFWQLTRLPLWQVLVSGLYLLRFVIYATVLVSLPKLKSEHKFFGLYLAGFTLATLGWGQYFLYPNLRNLIYLGWDPHQYRLFSTLLDPNFAGIVLVLTLILGWHLLNSQLQNERRRLLMVTQTISFLALLLTYSRGSYVAFIAALLAIAVIKRQKKLLVIFGSLLLVGIFLLPRPGGEGVNLTRIVSVGSRIANTTEALNLFRSSPVLGHGFNTLRFIRSQPKEADPNLLHSAGGFHNAWLTLLTTGGIAGLAAYFWIWKQLVATDKHPLLIISLIAVFTHSLFDNSLFYPQVMVWLWILASASITTSPRG